MSLREHITHPRPGDIFWIKPKLGRPECGDEVWAERPGVVVSHRYINENMNTVNVVMCTSHKSALWYQPLLVPITIKNESRFAICQQLHTIDKSRLTNYLGRTTDEELSNIKKALSDVLDLGKDRNSGAMYKWIHEIARNPKLLLAINDIDLDPDGLQQLLHEAREEILILRSHNALLLDKISRLERLCS